MEQDTGRGQGVRELLASVGILVTDEGVERARRELRAAEARRNPDALNALRERIGLPPKTA